MSSRLGARLVEPQPQTEALSDPERIREATRQRYLSARDLMSAALREVQQHDKLSQVMPGLKDLLAAPSSSGGGAASIASADT